MRIICLISCVLLPLALAAQQPDSTRVGTIAIEGAPESILEVIPLRSGDILTTELIRASIQALFDEGRYGQIEVDASESQDGTTSLTFLGHSHSASRHAAVPAVIQLLGSAIRRTFFQNST